MLKGRLKKQDHFIVSGTTWAEHSGNVVWSRCQFNSKHYSPHLYSQLKIDCPGSIKRAATQRQSEYLAGRYVVSQAMRKALIAYAEPLLMPVDERRCPVWPHGVIGTISHCRDHAICIVARQTDLSALGVDIELLLSAEAASEIQSRVHTRAELLELTSAGFEPDVATTIVFSAKESFFKAFYPRVKAVFGFEAVQVVAVDTNSGSLVFSVDEHFKKQYRMRSYYRCYFIVKESKVLTYILEPRNSLRTLA